MSLIWTYTEKQKEQAYDGARKLVLGIDIETSLERVKNKTEYRLVITKWDAILSGHNPKNYLHARYLLGRYPNFNRVKSMMYYGRSK